MTRRPRPVGVTRTAARAFALAILILCGAPRIVPAEDTDQFRFYGAGRLGFNTRLNLRPVPGVEVDRNQQSYGFSFGVNLGRYFGLEIAGDQSQTDLSVPGLGKIGEYGTFTLLPQARLRYPLLDGRLTPYIVGGVGAGRAEFNDRKPHGVGLEVQAQDWGLVGAVGVGLEYFVANNVAFGLEGKYIISRDHEIRINGQGGSANLDSFILALSLRLLFPETPAVEASPAVYDQPGRFYLGIRYGGSYTLERHVGGNIEAHPGHDSIGGSSLDQLLALAVGWDFHRMLGVELTAGGFSPFLSIQGIGSVADYAMYYLVPQVKLRFPLLEGRLVPYVMGGVGMTYFEVKDKKPHSFPFKLEGTEVSLAGLVGGGIDYFVARNIAVGFELEYLISRDNTVTFQSQKTNINADALLMSAGVRVYFGK